MGYKENNFKELLGKSRYLIWLGRQESQGIALEETLSCDIPILICDVSSVGHCIGGGELNQEEKDFKDTTSAEYFDKRCGIKIKDLDEIGEAVDKMEADLHDFSPRKYILENLSLEKQARGLLSFYEKYFGLSYDGGLKEKPLNYGTWLNGRWYYVIYLKARHTLKTFLVKIGLWSFIYDLKNRE